MSKLKKFILFFLLAIFLFSGIFSFVSATVTEAPLPGWDPEAVERRDLLPAYIRYLFNLSLMIAGLIAFGVLVYAGFTYLTSVGDPAKMSDAKDRILAAFLGLVILLSSYLILVTIDPHLVVLELDPVDPAPEAGPMPGVYIIYIEDGEEKSFGPLISSADDLKELRGKKIERIEIVNPTAWDPEKGKVAPTKYTFGAIMHESTEQRGACGVFLDSSPISTPFHGEPIVEVSSVTVFTKVESLGYGSVALCRKAELAECEEFKGPSLGKYPLVENLRHNVYSIGISGPYLVVLSGDRPAAWAWGGVSGTQCSLFFSSSPNLKISPMNRCRPNWYTPWWAWWRSCATDAVIIPRYIPPVIVP